MPWEIVQIRDAADIENPYKPEPALAIMYDLKGVGLFSIYIKKKPFIEADEAGKKRILKEAIERDIKERTAFIGYRG